jgi:hypothetical protein
MIGPHHALALRRLLLAVSAVAATLVAHALCAGGLAVRPAGLALSGSSACLAVIARPAAEARWREWSPCGLLARLLVVEIALHLALTVAPWAFGITVHHAPPLLSPTVLVVHGSVVLLFGLALLGAQRLLSAAVRIVRALRRALRAAPSRLALRLRAHEGAPVSPHSRSRRPRAARGPPAPAS